MVDTLDVTEADIWAAFDRAFQTPDFYEGKDARSVPQLAEHYGCSPGTARKRANAAVERGEMRKVVLRGGNGKAVDGWVPTVTLPVDENGA